VSFKLQVCRIIANDASTVKALSAQMMTAAALQAQQHSFNCPYQLASPTKWPEADKPEDADVYEVELLHGDIVVLGSDGLFDNMWNHEMEVIVRNHIKVGCRYTWPSET
jgi:hypothetical protein